MAYRPLIYPMGEVSIFCSEEVRSGTVHTEDELPKRLTEEILKPLPSHVGAHPSKVEIDWAKTKLLLAERQRFWS